MGLLCTSRVLGVAQTSLGGLRQEVHAVKQLGSSSAVGAGAHGTSQGLHGCGVLAPGSGHVVDAMDSLLPGMGMRPLLSRRRFSMGSDATGESILNGHL